MGWGLNGGAGGGGVTASGGVALATVDGKGTTVAALEPAPASAAFAPINVVGMPVTILPSPQNTRTITLLAIHQKSCVGKFEIVK